MLTINFKGKTVVFIAVIAMILSSLGTIWVVGDGGLIDQLEMGTLFSPEGARQAAEFKTHEEKLKQAYQTIKSSYLHKVNDEQLIDGAIKGMIESLGDPYSAYMSPKQAIQFQQGLESSFTGIGAEVTLKNGRVTIISPIKDSPAEKAGLRSGDQVLKVNGISLEGMDIHEAVSKIRGPKGTKARLQIARPGVRDILTITVVRDEISLQTVEAAMMSGHIGRITLTQFSENTAEDFARGLKKLESQGLEGLIIDVRGNPGGLLPSVLDICDQLVPDKQKVLMTEDKSGSRSVFNSKLEGKKPYPIAVLIDKGSASASEILAAALQESGNYALVGETTFGKGTVQTTKSFKDGSNVKITIAKWLTPKGNWIDQHGGTKGIKPDIPVDKPAYMNAIPPQVKEPLQRDDNLTEVKNMQLILDALGYHPGRTDGYFDSQTEQAVKAFQKKEGFAATGKLDAKAAEVLREAFISFLREPGNDITLQVAIQYLKKK
ncbi:S41 family peptidase [Thermoactinomyces mirandus]|uniref:S41 family peptidase n=1 Tax=Thermoactinomyces mirandus TaxID=2756294 RepID=UPI0028AD9859|nr:S41 family peptidase [Thermoactinomyces mirandus]